MANDEWHAYSENDYNGKWPAKCPLWKYCILLIILKYEEIMWSEGMYLMLFNDHNHQWYSVIML